jgi:hypothetical protein
LTHVFVDFSKMSELLSELESFNVDELSFYE